MIRTRDLCSHPITHAWIFFPIMSFEEPRLWSQLCRLGLVAKISVPAASYEKPLVFSPVYCPTPSATRKTMLLLMTIPEDQQSYIRSMSLCTLKKSKVNRGLETRSCLESPRHARI
ncbi:hypothetical protein AVEN_182772-1 [Araneus ventricosus]|uniref:Uncharacterized protein n=1 Tax=Araneus ventricosus TaxID=182803 RepID=A0A4Y2LGE2_ARAVE|nr:hypothetical protein AVEN_182772-1 [Araneus ventricosus]